MRRIARSYRLSEADVDDVVQTTWLRLLVHIAGLRDPDAVRAWLATTVRRESLHLLQRGVREQLSADPELGDAVEYREPDEGLLSAERRAALRRAIADLPPHQRSLLSLLAVEDEPDYQRIGAILGMPVGSIGPTRARAFARLRRHSELALLCAPQPL